MKKIFFYIITISLALTANSLQATPTDSLTVVAQTAEAKKLVERLTELKAIDKSELSTIEKKQMRAEVISIEKRLKTMNGGVYISVGGIIIILLLLILIF